MTVATLLVASLVAANPYLVEGKEHFSHLQYTEALRPLTLAVAVPGQTAAERREAYDLLARTRAALGDLAGTSEAYGELLAKDPNAPAPTDAAPKIREAFRAAKTSLFAPGVVKLTRVTAGEGHLAFELTDPWAAVTRLEVHEIAGNSRNITVTVSERERQAGLFDVKVPATLVQAWVEAFNGENTVVATLGSLRVPLRLAKSHAPSPTSPTKRDEPASSGPTTEPGRVDVPLATPPPPKTTVALAPPTLPPPPNSWKTPLVVTSGALALIGAGLAIGFGLAARQDLTTLAALLNVSPVTGISQRDAYALADKQRQEAVVANVAFTAATTFAVSTVLLLLLAPSSSGGAAP